MVSGASRRIRSEAPKDLFELDITAEGAEFLSKIETNSRPFGEIGGSYFGIQTFDRAQFVSDRPRSRCYKPVIDGENVLKWTVVPPTAYVDFRPENIKSGGDPNIYAKSRIVVRQIGRFPEGALCPDGTLTLNTIYNLYLTSNLFDLRFVLGVINSSVTRFYWLKRFFDNKETFPKIKKQPLHSIRIPNSTPDQQNTVATLVDHLAWLSRSPSVTASSAAHPRDPLMAAYFEQWLNALVYELFFPAELNTAGLRFFQMFPQCQFSTGPGPKTPEEAQLETTRCDFARLSAPGHPLRVALNHLQTLDAVRTD